MHLLVPNLAGELTITVGNFWLEDASCGKNWDQTCRIKSPLFVDHPQHAIAKQQAWKILECLQCLFLIENMYISETRKGKHSCTDFTCQSTQMSHRNHNNRNGTTESKGFYNLYSLYTGTAREQQTKMVAHPSLLLRALTGGGKAVR